ncbi:radical SAM protein [Patescibacteria group bacterium]|nr:radical SAM protein [Patescibacteria group bacterium]
MFPKYPQAVFIQTVSGCTSDCVICPEKKTFARFGKQKMSKELYEKILNDLTIDYPGQVGLYLHFEPLLDERVFDFLRLAKKKCPKSSVEISSNASLLDKENAHKLSESGIDLVHFNVNGATKKTYEKQMRGLNFENMLKNINYFRKVYDKPIKINFVLSNDNLHEKDMVADIFPGCEIVNDFWAVNRAGNVEINKSEANNTRFRDEKNSCNQLEMNLPILATGEAILCCNDWMRTAIVGDVNKENVLDVWQSSKRHYGYDICDKCF